MMLKTKILLAGTGLLGLGILILALTVRPDLEPAPRKKVRRAAVAAAAIVEGEPELREAPAVRARELAPAVEEVRIRSTYDSYRTAVATGDVRLAAALRPILVRDGETALLIAEEEIGLASTEEDRDIAERALRGLRGGR